MLFCTLFDKFLSALASVVLHHKLLLRAQAKVVFHNMHLHFFPFGFLHFQCLPKYVVFLLS